MIKLVIAEEQDEVRKNLLDLMESTPEINVIGLAKTGEEAIRLCEDKIPDILLTGIQMQVMNGIEATKKIKQRWPAIKVIILTNFQDIDHVREALKAGAEGYILKEVEPQFLLNGIELVFYGGTLIPQHLTKDVFLTVIDTVKSGEEQLSSANPYNLNARKLKVLMYMVQGVSNQGIAELMFLSVGTVKNYVSSIYSKLQVKNRSSAIAKAIEELLIDDNSKTSPKQ